MPFPATFVNNKVQLSNKDIERFQKIYSDMYDSEISKEETIVQATKLINLLWLIYTPMTDERFEEIQKYMASILPDILQQIARIDEDGINDK